MRLFRPTKTHAWNAKCPIFLGNLGPLKPATIALEIGHLAFQVVDTWSIFGPGKNTQQKWPAPLTCRQLLVFSFFETTAFLGGGNGISGCRAGRALASPKKKWTTKIPTEKWINRP